MSTSSLDFWISEEWLFHQASPLQKTVCSCSQSPSELHWVFHRVFTHHLQTSCESEKAEQQNRSYPGDHLKAS